MWDMGIDCLAASTNRKLGGLGVLGRTDFTLIMCRIYSAVFFAK